MNPWSIKSAWKGDPEPQMSITSNPSMGGCIVKNVENLGVRLASDVINEGKKALKHSLVGCLKENEGIPKVVSWLKFFQGKLPVDIKMTGSSMVWIKLHSEAEVEEAS